MIQISNKVHEGGKKVAKLILWLLWISLILALGIFLLAVVARHLSSSH